MHHKSQKMFQMVTIHIKAHSKAFPERPYDCPARCWLNGHKPVECVAACRLVSEYSGTYCPLQFPTGRSRVAKGPENVKATIRGLLRRQLLWLTFHMNVISIEWDQTTQLFSTFCVNVKMQYTLNQRLFLVKQYWITNSITATQRAYQREFGVRNPPKRNTILGLVNKLETTGSLETGYTYSMCQRAAKSAGLKPSFFDDRIISRNLWPPRSPDLTTSDFFLWGYLKDGVYATRPQTLEDLKHITQEIQAIDNRVLQRVASNMERRVELCLMQDGGHFQHLL
ncbi:hypothetical protein ANN_23322 [Periplaneta americana]|uniref:DUF4817 domain-containing protein n=1 Tax=Periplaneta americana TaxID=6978 RepID=A0ABQ8SL81_PERAM|nr:hypothetical protein ANN_23322 [Periplaneta americana]